MGASYTVMGPQRRAPPTLWVYNAVTLQCKHDLEVKVRAEWGYSSHRSTQVFNAPEFCCWKNYWKKYNFQKRVNMRLLVGWSSNTGPINTPAATCRRDVGKTIPIAPTSIAMPLFPAAADQSPKVQSVQSVPTQNIKQQAQQGDSCSNSGVHF